MFLDEFAARLLVVLTLAVVIALFAIIGLCFGTQIENRETERENKALRRYVMQLEKVQRNGRDDYKREFERRMKQNTADPARHEREDV